VESYKHSVLLSAWPKIRFFHSGWNFFKSLGFLLFYSADLQIYFRGKKFESVAVHKISQDLL